MLQIRDGNVITVISVHYDPIELLPENNGLFLQPVSYPVFAFDVPV